MNGIKYGSATLRHRSHVYFRFFSALKLCVDREYIFSMIARSLSLFLLFSLKVYFYIYWKGFCLKLIIVESVIDSGFCASFITTFLLIDSFLLHCCLYFSSKDLNCWYRMVGIREALWNLIYLLLVIRQPWRACGLRGVTWCIRYHP